MMADKKLSIVFISKKRIGVHGLDIYVSKSIEMAKKR
jgi:hypothetical protein